jgi:hypothetical protein
MELRSAEIPGIPARGTHSLVHSTALMTPLQWPHKPAEIDRHPAFCTIPWISDLQAITCQKCLRFEI